MSYITHECRCFTFRHLVHVLVSTIYVEESIREIWDSLLKNLLFEYYLFIFINKSYLYIQKLFIYSLIYINLIYYSTNELIDSYFIKSDYQSEQLLKHLLCLEKFIDVWS